METGSEGTPVASVGWRRERHGRAAARGGGRRHGWASSLLALAAALGLLAALSGLAGCGQFHGPLTNLGQVDQYLSGRWDPDPARSQVAVNAGIYPMPGKHLILVHVQIPDTSITSLGPGAVHGAVGVWWIALDDRVPGGDGALAWVPSCDRFTTHGQGSEFTLAGSYMSGPATASLSRYPISFNPEDSSISVALSPEDEIKMPARGSAGTTHYLLPVNQVCAVS